MRVYALEGEALATTRLEEHATGHGTWEMHAQLGVEAEMGDDAGFLSLLLPTRHDESAPAVTASSPRDGLVTAEVAFADEVYSIEFSVEDGLAISGAGWPSAAR